MATLIKGMARFKVLWSLDQPLDKVFLHREGQILVEISSLLQSRLRRRLLLCQCTRGLSVGTSQGKQWCSFIAYEKVYCIQGVVQFIESCTLDYIGWEWLWCWCLHGTALTSLVIHTQAYKEQSISYSCGTRPVFLVELLQIYGEYSIWALKLHWKLWPSPLSAVAWHFSMQFHGVIYSCWMSVILDTSINCLWGFH